MSKLSYISQRLRIAFGTSKLYESAAKCKPNRVRRIRKDHVMSE